MIFAVKIRLGIPNKSPETVRLWTTEQSQCVRIFVGHFSDVDCLTFHPNNNYVASGSSDRSVRLWDGLTGNCVRLMTGHKAAISAVEFSVDGRFLVSGGNDNRVLGKWDEDGDSLPQETPRFNLL